MRLTRYLASSFVALLLLLGAPLAAHDNFADDAQVAEFITEMQQRHGFDADELRALMADARRLDEVLERMSKPAESLAWHRYRDIFVTETRIAGGVEFWREHADTLARAEQRFGVDAAYIVAIIGVETAYGRFKGKLRVLDALATLAFGYPRRAKFFRRELEKFLLLTRADHLPVRELRGSYAGAMGMPQFIPSSYLAYAVDFDGDGIRDLLGSAEDAIGSVANYLAEHGWRRGAAVTVRAQAPSSATQTLLEKGNKPHAPVGELVTAGVVPGGAVDDTASAALIKLDAADGDELWLVFRNFYAITRYNPSNLYAMAVSQLADAVRSRRQASGDQG